VTAGGSRFGAAEESLGWDNAPPRRPAGGRAGRTDRGRRRFPAMVCFQRLARRFSSASPRGADARGVSAGADKTTRSGGAD